MWLFIVWLLHLLVTAVVIEKGCKQKLINEVFASASCNRRPEQAPSSYG